MKFEEAREALRGILYIHPYNAERIYQHILKTKPKRILELGIGHGTSTCYMAAALQEIGEGKVTAIDLISVADEFDPSAEDLTARLGLSNFVEIHRMQTSYTWFLHDEIARHSDGDICTPQYDLCIIDGAKNWTIDSSAFFLVDKLLLPGSLLVFDDYAWTYKDADTRRDQTDGIVHRELSQAELVTPHVREIFNLLVRQHPQYHKFEVDEEHDWALAWKKD